jgi:hypothetical protein
MRIMTKLSAVLYVLRESGQIAALYRNAYCATADEFTDQNVRVARAHWRMQSVATGSKLVCFAFRMRLQLWH